MSDILTLTVHVDARRRVTVVSPGERMRIVAAPAKIAAVAGQRVAELVEEALQAIDGPLHGSDLESRPAVSTDAEDGA